MVPNYFGADGDYTVAAVSFDLDTTGWSEEIWDYINNLSDAKRMEVLVDLAQGCGSIDQQDCPAFTGEDFTEECGFSGPVYRDFFDPERGESGGYDWECPSCGSTQDWEGEDIEEEV